jgi:hypothetical protein
VVCWGYAWTLVMHGGTAAALVGAVLGACMFMYHVINMCHMFMYVCDAWVVSYGARGWCATLGMHGWRAV